MRYSEPGNPAEYSKRQNLINTFSKKTRDLVIAVLLVILSFYLGYRHFHENSLKGHFYQEHFGPAVALACGKGFVDIDPAGSRELMEFLGKRRDSFQCEDLPARIREREPSRWSVFQKQNLYLIGAVGLLWKITGVSWSGMAPLVGALYAVLIVTGYGFFRLGMGRAFAAALALVFMVSPLQLGFLLNYRDFSKAPFILAFVFIVGLIVIKRPGRRALFGLFAVLGAILGVGMGFRQDVLICLPFLPASLLFFRTGDLIEDIKNKAAALLIFFAVFFLSGLPVISQQAKRSNSWHAALIGLLPVWNSGLRIDKPEFYEWVNAPYDGYIVHLVTGRENLIKGAEGRLEYQTREYDVAGRRYYFEIVKNFPADFMTRFNASVLKILDIPFRTAYRKPPIGGYVYLVLGQLRDLVLYDASRIGLFFSVAAVFFIGTQSARLALFAIFVILYFSAYPVLQFTQRHYFYLEIIGLWTAGFVVYNAASGAMKLAKEKVGGRTADAFPHEITIKGILKGLSIVVIVLVLFTATLYAARRSQQDHLTELFNVYLSKKKHPLKTWEQPWKNGKTIIRWPYDYNRDEYWYLDTYYIRAEFDLNRCGADELKGKFFYYSKRGSNDYSIFFTARKPDMKGGKTVLMFPAFNSAISVFLGLELDNENLDCFDGLYRITDFKGIPLLLYLNLPAGWGKHKLYSTIK